MSSDPPAPFTHTWEEAVLWLRSQPDQRELVRSCYYDDPLVAAAERYRTSEEWQAIEALLGQRLAGQVLDLGSGRGISAYAFARAGCQVTALEPNPSEIVGAGAIRQLNQRVPQPITIVQTYGETLPFADRSFDVVYGRAVFHHAQDIRQFSREAARVLKPGGVLLFTREHVLSQKSDLDKFLAAHPLHRLYGGENAYLLSEYRQALGQAGLVMEQVLKPFDSAINYSPITTEALRDRAAAQLAKFTGTGVARSLVQNNTLFSWIKFLLSQLSQTPGRPCSFVATKP